MKKIDYRFKILYAIGTILVVAEHCGGGGISLMGNWFAPYAFHLPLFVFASGYFYSDDSLDDVGQYTLHKLKKLILPVYIWNLLYGLFDTFLRVFGFTIGEELTVWNLLVAPLIDGHQFSFNLGGWFVVPLFMVQIINALLRKLLQKIHFPEKEAVMFGAYLLIGIGGVYLAQGGYNQQGWLFLVRITYFMPFYALGILYKKRLEQKDKLPNFLYFGIVMLLQLIIITYYGEPVIYTAAWCKNYEHHPLIPFVVGTLGIAFWLRIASILEPVLKNSKVVLMIADNSYSIMIHQFFGFMIVKTFFAFGHRVSSLFADFDMEMYKDSIWYFYVPNNVDNWYIVYLAAGIVIPVLIYKMTQIILNRSTVVGEYFLDFLHKK